MPNIIRPDSAELSDECFIYKHSTRCPVSADAAEEVQALDTALPIFWIDVIEQRPLSQAVADRFAIKHESPQLLLVRGGAVSRVWNHRKIRREDITDS